MLGTKLSSDLNELIAVSAIFLVCVILVYILGRGKTVALILSFYPAIFLYRLFPLSETLLFFNKTETHILLKNFAIFLVFFAVIFIIITAITGKTMAYKERGGLFKTVILSFSLLILSLVTIHQVIYISSNFIVLSKSSLIFSSEELFFWILSIPLLMVLLFARK